MSTPLFVPFITVAEFLNAYDSRRIADYLYDGPYDDEGTKPTKAEMLTNGSTANLRIRYAIASATDRIVGAAQVGNRYTRTELETIVSTDGQGTYEQARGPDFWLLYRITADLAFGELVKRRALPAEKMNEQAPSFAAAEQYLELLRQGVRIFASVPDVPEAGLPDTTSMTPRLGINPPLMSQSTRLFGCRPSEQLGPYYYGNQ